LILKGLLELSRPFILGFCFHNGHQPPLRPSEPYNFAIPEGANTPNCIADRKRKEREQWQLKLIEIKEVAEE